MRTWLIQLLLFLLDTRGSMRFRGKDIREFKREVSNTFGGSPSLPLDSVQFNESNSFGGSADFRYQDSPSTGVLIGQNVRLNLSENGGPGDVYVKYNSSNDYLEVYTDGNLRAQF
jgi:hypothetical protein